jgi:hypothetical protein
MPTVVVKASRVKKCITDFASRNGVSPYDQNNVMHFFQFLCTYPDKNGVRGARCVPYLIENNGEHVVRDGRNVFIGIERAGTFLTMHHEDGDVISYQVPMENRRAILEEFLVVRSVCALIHDRSVPEECLDYYDRLAIEIRAFWHSIR